MQVSLDCITSILITTYLNKWLKYKLVYVIKYSGYSMIYFYISKKSRNAENDALSENNYYSIRYQNLTFLHCKEIDKCRNIVS